MLHSVETPLLPKKSRQTFCFKGTWLLAGAILLVFVFSPIHHRSPTFETEVAAFLDHASTKSICSSPSYRGPPCVLITGYGPFAQFQNNPASKVSQSLDGFCNEKLCVEGWSLDVDRAGAEKTASALRAHYHQLQQNTSLRAMEMRRAPWSLILHLGLEDAAKGLTLETMAMNILVVQGGRGVHVPVQNRDLPCPPRPPPSHPSAKLPRPRSFAALSSKIEVADSALDQSETLTKLTSDWEVQKAELQRAEQQLEAALTQMRDKGQTGLQAARDQLEKQTAQVAQLADKGKPGLQAAKQQLEKAGDELAAQKSRVEALLRDMGDEVARGLERLHEAEQQHDGPGKTQQQDHNDNNNNNNNNNRVMSAAVGSGYTDRQERSSQRRERAKSNKNNKQDTEQATRESEQWEGRTRQNVDHVRQDREQAVRQAAEEQARQDRQRHQQARQSPRGEANEDERELALRQSQGVGRGSGEERHEEFEWPRQEFEWPRRTRSPWTERDELDWDRWQSRRERERERREKEQDMEESESEKHREHVEARRIKRREEEARLREKKKEAATTTTTTTTPLTGGSSAGAATATTKSPSVATPPVAGITGTSPPPTGPTTATTTSPPPTGLTTATTAPTAPTKPIGIKCDFMETPCGPNCCKFMEACSPDEQCCALGQPICAGKCCQGEAICGGDQCMPKTCENIQKYQCPCDPTPLNCSSIEQNRRWCHTDVFNCTISNTLGKTQYQVHCQCSGSARRTQARRLAAIVAPDADSAGGLGERPLLPIMHARDLPSMAYDKASSPGGGRPWPYDHMSGRVPSLPAIVYDAPCLLATTADLSALNLRTLGKGFDALEFWSRDAGSFFCNEIFFRTLHMVRQLGLHPSNMPEPTGLSAGLLHTQQQHALLPVMFVHLPDPAVLSVEEASALVLRLAEMLLPRPVSSSAA